MKKSAKFFSLIVGLSLFTQSLYGDAGNATVSIGTNGSLWAWGANGSGQLGDGSWFDQSEPVQESTQSDDWISVGAGGNHTDSSLSAGSSHTAAIKTDGSLWTWGENNSGQLGDGSWLSEGIPVQEARYDNDWRSVSAGGKHTVAIKANGTLWAWGANGDGQLGDGTWSDQSEPVQESTSSDDWNSEGAVGNYSGSSVSAGGNHTVAIKTNGSLWAWGANDSGQLGNGSWSDSNSPTQINNEYNWITVSAGDKHTTAIKTDSTLWAWGANGSGQLGDGSMSDQGIPVQEARYDNDWRSVSAGGNHTVAIKTDGSLWAWGANSQGQLGNGTVNNSTTPVQEYTEAHDWSSVSAGGNHTVATKTDGSLWAWGANNSGQLGDGLTVMKTIPVQESSKSTNWSSASAGDKHTVAIKDDGGNFNPSIICYLLF